MSPVPQAVFQQGFGSPEKVLSLHAAAVAEPGPGEVMLALRRASLNPSDFGMIAGSYGKRPELPAVAGREGWGEVVRVGAGISEWSRGDRARMPETSGVLRQAVTVKAANLVRIPNPVDPQQAAMAFINPPSAYRLLEDFIDLESGDWIVQNAANSALGLCVCGFARSRGIKVLALCRDSAERKNLLLTAGAAAVAEDDDSYPAAIGELTGGQRPRLALNSVGGPSVQRMIKSLADGGMCVTFGGMTAEAVKFPTRYLIFNDISLCGFWMDRWLRTHGTADIQHMMNRIFTGFTDGEISIPVAAEYAFEDALQAFAHAARPRRSGKVLIRSDWQP